MKKFDDFFEHLSETRLLSRTKMDKFEKQRLFKKIKTAIKENKLTIMDRYKNNKFMKKKHLKTEDAINIINEYLTPRNIIASVNNITNLNEKNRIDDFLYVCELQAPKVGWMYLKFQELKHDRIEFVSFHESSEKMYVDFSNTDDLKDSNDDFMELVATRTMERYNNHSGNADKPRILDYSIRDRYTVYFTFSEDIPRSMINDLKESLRKSFPNDMGIYDTATINSFYVDGRLASIEFRITSYTAEQESEKKFKKGVDKK